MSIMDGPSEESEKQLETSKQDTPSDKDDTTAKVEAGEQDESLTRAKRAAVEGNLNQVKLPFPWKVQEMLSNVETEGRGHIVSWLPHGKSFRVHKEKDFVATIMREYFNQSKFTSFTRQLYIYGFQKVQDGPDKGAFFHKDFTRDNKSLSLSMKRKKDKPLQKQPDPTDFLPRTMLSSVGTPSRTSGAHVPQQLLGVQALTSLSLRNQAPQPSLAAAINMGLSNINPSFAAPPTLHSSVSLPINPSIRAPQLQTSSSSTLPGSSRLAAVAAPAALSQQTEEEEDWLAKYERLTARNTPPHDRVVPGSITSSSSAAARLSLEHGDRQVRGDDVDDVAVDWQQIYEQASQPNLISFSACDSLGRRHSSSNACNSLVGPRQTREDIEVEKIHPRWTQPPNRGGATRDPRSNQRISEPSKESDTLSDGDEVDFEGMKFHFVDE